MSNLKTFRLRGHITVGAHTEVRARSQKEAVMLACKREAGIILMRPDPHELWVVDDADGSPFNIHGDDEVAAVEDTALLPVFAADAAFSEEEGERRTIRLSGHITVSTYTDVEAQSLEEAKTIAASREAVIGDRRSGALSEETWVVEEADGMALNIRIDEDPAAIPTP